MQIKCVISLTKHNWNIIKNLDRLDAYKNITTRIKSPIVIKIRWTFTIIYIRIRSTTSIKRPIVIKIRWTFTIIYIRIRSTTSIKRPIVIKIIWTFTII